MTKFPLYLDLQGKRAVVIGSGKHAAHGIKSLQLAGCRVICLAEQLTPQIREAAVPPGVNIIISSYSKQYLSGAMLVVAAAASPELNSKIRDHCHKMDIMCCLPDFPNSSDFCIPEVLDRFGLRFAVAAPSNCRPLQRRIRSKLEKLFDETHGLFAEEISTTERRLIESLPDSKRREELIGQLVREESFEYFQKKGPEAWRQRAFCLFGHMLNPSRGVKKSPNQADQST